MNEFKWHSLKAYTSREYLHGRKRQMFCQLIINKSNPAVNENRHHDQFIPGMRRWFSTRQSINIICPNNKLSKDYHMIRLVYGAKVLHRIQYSLMTKTLRTPSTEGNFINSMKDTYRKPSANRILNSVVPHPSLISLSAVPVIWGQPQSRSQW